MRLRECPYSGKECDRVVEGVETMTTSSSLPGTVDFPTSSGSHLVSSQTSEVCGGGDPDDHMRIGERRPILLGPDNTVRRIGATSVFKCVTPRYWP